MNTQNTRRRDPLPVDYLEVRKVQEDRPVVYTWMALGCGSLRYYPKTRHLEIWQDGKMVDKFSSQVIEQVYHELIAVAHDDTMEITPLYSSGYRDD